MSDGLYQAEQDRESFGPSAENDAPHHFERTIPTDGRWCQRCGLPEAQWDGSDCPGMADLAALEARILSRITPPGVDQG